MLVSFLVVVWQEEGRAAGDCVDGEGKAGTCPSQQANVSSRTEPEDDMVSIHGRCTFDKISWPLGQHDPLTMQESDGPVLCSGSRRRSERL
jgi:hypothetical protein